MKIVYAKFVNFAGVYAGLGRKELELDFSKSKNKIVMLLGGNGAGKTTILSLLHPYRDTNDIRTNYILENEEGYKEVHLKLNDDLYIIKHYYGKHNKSFISKNGEELNENGGIRTFDATLEDEFSLKKDYFKIARLGSNVTTFIDLKTAERKKYMNNFLPDIDDYLTAYDVVNEKFKNLTNTIKSIRIQLDKLDSKENLEELEKTLSENIQNIEVDNKKLTSLIDKSEARIEDLSKSLEIGEGLDYKQFMSQLIESIEEARKYVDEADRTMSAIYEKYPKLSEYSDEKIEDSVLEYNKNITVAEQEIKGIKSNIDSIEKDIVRLHNEKTSKNNIIKNEVDISYIENQITDKENYIDELTNTLSRNEFSDVDMTIQEVSRIQSYSESTVTMIESIKEQHSNSVIEHLDPNQFSVYGTELDKYYKELDKADSQKLDVDEKINRINSNDYLLDTLNARPDACKIDTCPFIVKALDYKNNEHSQLDRLYEEQTGLYNLIDGYNDEIKGLEAIADYVEDLNKLYKQLNNPFAITFILSGFEGVTINEVSIFAVTELMKKDISVIQKIFDMSELVKVINTKAELEKEQEKIESLKSHLELALKQKSIIDQAKDELEEINKEIEKSTEAKETEKNNIDVKERFIKSNKIKLNLVNSIKSFRKIISEKSVELNELQAEYDKKINTVLAIKKEEDAVKDNNHYIDTNNKQLKPLKDKLKTVQRDLVIIDDCVTRLKDVEENYDSIRIIKDALDPKKGIPLFFIDNYLKDIAVRANNLLSVAYGDAFKIKFDISASDFFINVFKADGTFLSDIKEASQGETSLTTVSLSLGMIERMMASTKYNILYLDEVDSTLSTKNRRLFITLLENQLEKLGIEQVFVISHNNEFESHPTDMILLKENNVDVDDKEFMQNKNIVFKY
jgi:DNA repair exonuclease SbcCD ATPase subunit